MQFTHVENACLFRAGFSGPNQYCFYNKGENALQLEGKFFLKMKLCQLEQSFSTVGTWTWSMFQTSYFKNNILNQNLVVSLLPRIANRNTYKNACFKTLLKIF
jgi:hypothetical protein